MSDNKAATEFILHSYTARIPCPYCAHENTFWLSDPRGGDTQCDECEKNFDIPEDIQIIIE